MQQVDPVVRYLSTSVTSSKEQSALHMNSSYNQQPAPVISSRQQLTASLSSKEQSTPGTDNNQFIPVMSIQQSLTDVRDQDQSLPSPGIKCQASQYKVNDQQIKYVMSNYEQMTTNRSDDNKTYPDNHHVIRTITKIPHATSAVSNLQESPPVMSKVQQKSSHMTSVYHTIPLVGENQPKISHTGHVEPIIQHTSIEYLIPEKQIIPIISNTQLTSIPTTLTEPVLTVSNMQPDSSTVPQVSYSMLAPVVTSHTNESLKKQSASAPWQFIASPHRNTEPQQYMMILPKEIEHKTPELTVKSMEKVKSTMHVKDSTSYGNKSNRAKVEGRQIKQTARKSTKARPTKSKLAAQLDKLFVDVGILSTETQHSMTENNEIVSEADRIKGGVTDNSAGMPMTWDFSSNETNCDKNNFLQPQVLSGLPEMANASNTVQSFNNISDSTKVRPPPPLKQFFPQTKRKVTRVTCPPLTPLHKMTKLSPEASEYWRSSSTKKTDII
ncbi:hypothetical protein E2C01_053930 [Portunus trituberculatus]|uniref:Uncharacterized protein n=2 Tax=Portunus trituberculatus TaxID=210409 RepID=A0A5B7GII5_PORTR|nr:hypothetical protein [Portunus trituberculatus]